MCVVAFSAAHWNFSRLFLEDLFDRHRFGVVVELCRTGMRINVVNLFRREACISQSIAHSLGAGLAVGQRRGHVVSIVIQAVTEHFRVNARTTRTSVFEFFNDQ